MNDNKIQYHNPENVPADKVPKGWRFLTMEEQLHRARLGADAPMGCRYWFPDMDEFSINSNGTGATRDWTYIIPDTQPEPAPSPWIAFSERKPTEADADENRFVWTASKNSVYAHHINDTRGQTHITHWMPREKRAIPPLPVERKKSQEEKDNEAAVDYAVGRALTGCFQEARIAFLAGLRHARAQGKEQP